jgi:DNA polymerase-3 subunit gamma/tau
MLTKEAFNALLKTLEEPPGHVIFIFATTEAHKVLPTILSRCQRYDFKRIKSDEIIDRLRGIAETEGITIGPNALRLLARESEGSLRDSLSLFDQVIAFSGNDVSDDHVADALGLIDQTLVSELARAVLDGRAGDAMDVLERVHGFGYDAKDFAAQVLAYHRALVVVKVSQRPEEILDLIDAEVKELNQAAAGVSLETLHFHFNAWLDVQNQLHRSTYPRLVLEALIVRLCQTREIQPLAELLAKFEALAGSAGAAGPPPDPSGSSGSPAGGTNPQRGGGGPGGSLPPEGRRSAPPAPAPAPAEGSAQLDWPGFVDSIRVDHPLLYSVLSQGAADEFSARKVVLTLADENHRNLLDRNKLNTLLTDNFGRRPEVQVEVAPTASTGPDPAAAARARREQAKTDVLAHPLVREAAEIFSGEMVDFIEEPAE